jgi:hypothetical protein
VPHFQKLHSVCCGTFCEIKALSKPHLEQEGPMKNHERYQNNAERCLRLASGTNDPGIKGKLIDMAELWMKLAKKAERNNEIYGDKP